jgi:predicted dehydrogenase
MSDSIGCAVVGLGHIGVTYTRLLQETGLMDVVGACDVFGKARDSYRDTFGDVPVYEDVDGLLASEEFEAAVVVTSDPCHAEPFIKCLDAGKHVFVEKPVGNTVGEVREMVAAIDRNPGPVAASGHILRYYPINRKIKQMAEAGEFGEIFYMEGDYIHNLKSQGDPSRFNEALGKNWYLEEEKPMVGGGCHPFDVLRWVVDSPVVAVASMGNRIAFPAMHNDDCIVSLFRFESGCVAKVTALYGPEAPYAHCNNIAVYGTEKSVWRDQVCEDHAEGWKPLVVEAYEEKYSHGFEREMADFVGAIRTGSSVLAPARDSAQSEIATLVATEALKEKGEVEIPQITS